MPTKCAFHWHSARNSPFTAFPSPLLIFTSSLLIFTEREVGKIKGGLVRIKSGLIRIKWELIATKSGLVRKRPKSLLAVSGKRARKWQKCKAEVANSMAQTAKSPQNLLQNFVKIFYSFAKAGKGGNGTPE